MFALLAPNLNCSNITLAYKSPTPPAKKTLLNMLTKGSSPFILTLNAHNAALSFPIFISHLAKRSAVVELIKETVNILLKKDILSLGDRNKLILSPEGKVILKELKKNEEKGRRLLKNCYIHALANSSFNAVHVTKRVL